MTSVARVRQYIDYGFSAERIAELLHAPLNEVKALKREAFGLIAGASSEPAEIHSKNARVDRAVRSVLTGGKTPAEAAAATGAPLGLVQVAVARARAGLTQSLAVRD